MHKAEGLPDSMTPRRYTAGHGPGQTVDGVHTADRAKAGTTLRTTMAVVTGLLFTLAGATTEVAATGTWNHHGHHDDGWGQHCRRHLDKECKTHGEESEGGYVEVSWLERATPYDADGEDLARDNAPKIPLFSAGQLSIYGKCFRDTGTHRLRVETYIASEADGAIFSSREDDLEGGADADDFLNTDTPETDRRIQASRVSDDDGADFSNEDENDFSAVSADGETGLRGLTFQGAKQGILPFDGGAYGSGDGCLFGGFVAVSPTPSPATSP